jgi:hypothetical protein
LEPEENKNLFDGILQRRRGLIGLSLAEEKAGVSEVNQGLDGQFFDQERLGDEIVGSFQIGEGAGFKYDTIEPLPLLF